VHHSIRLAIVCLAFPLSFAACKRSETSQPPPAATPPVEAPSPTAQPAAAPFRVTDVQLGSGLGPDRRVSAPTTTFTPSDTIYASVASEGTAPGVTLTARWTYEDGQVVSESSQRIAPRGEAATEFHIARPSGWPAGRYQVQILADGSPVSSREFEVR
jgi:hypothetical protein